MNRQSKHEVLSDPNLPFRSKLLKATQFELVLWDQRKFKPNLGYNVFKNTIKHIPIDLHIEWETRRSKNGKYGDSGEPVCFKFEFNVHLFGAVTRYFVKGFFFEEHNLKGVEIQSFREVTLQNTIPLKPRNKQ